MTRRFRSIAMMGGLVMLFGVGAVALTRAQQPNADEPVSPRKALRDRLIKLRTEVEILKLEHDADKADLAEELKSLRSLQREGLDQRKIVAAETMATQFQMSKGFVDEKKFVEMLKESGLAELFKGKDLKDIDRNTFARALVEEETKEQGEKLKALKVSIAEKKKTFALRTLEFHEKKLDLDDAERRYNGTR
jgi:hypothetical protein